MKSQKSNEMNKIGREICWHSVFFESWRDRNLWNQSTNAPVQSAHLTPTPMLIAHTGFDRSIRSCVSSCLAEDLVIVYHSSSWIPNRILLIMCLVISYLFEKLWIFINIKSKKELKTLWSKTWKTSLRPNFSLDFEWVSIHSSICLNPSFQALNRTFNSVVLHRFRRAYRNLAVSVYQHNYDDTDIIKVELNRSLVIFERGRLFLE